jgi:hypothetical protein
LILLLVSSCSILAFRYSFFSFLKCLTASRLILLNYIHCFGLDPVTIAFQPAPFYLKNLNILHQTMVHAASIPTDLDSLKLRF